MYIVDEAVNKKEQIESPNGFLTVSQLPMDHSRYDSIGHLSPELANHWSTFHHGDRVFGSNWIFLSDQGV
jgi:hypothetical protein